MSQIQKIFDYNLFGNDAATWSTAAVIFFAVLIGLFVIRTVILVRMVALSKKTKTKIDDVISEFLHSIGIHVYFFTALFVALQGVSLPGSVELVVDIAILVIIVSQVIRFIEDVVCMVLAERLKREQEDAQLPGVFRITVRILLWSMGFLLILSNAGVDITSLVAGLGIGGLAISLALQNVLSDLFASFSIAVDKPFEIGDFIVVGDHKGTVKHIGMKTTRITALEGEEIVISNAELTSARVQNYKKMKERRIVFNFGCTYDAKPEQMEQITKDVGVIIDDHEHAKVDRVHFFAFGESDLQFEAVYYMTTSDYVAYMDTQQDINIRLMKYFAEQGLEMAYPTQTLYMKKDD